MMLHEFVTRHQGELIRRCRGKVALRGAPVVTSKELGHGVPTFLGQLADALLAEHELRLKQQLPAAGTPFGEAQKDIRSSSAKLHGKAMQEGGYTVEQVVHDYGDICQSITELATEKKAPITVDEFHTLNRLLDNAIADAVTAFASEQEASKGETDNADGELHASLGSLADGQRVLLETALKALYALRTGNIGARGATGQILETSLLELRSLVDRSLPMLRLQTHMTKPRKR